MDLSHSRPQVTLLGNTGLVAMATGRCRASALSRGGDGAGVHDLHLLGQLGGSLHKATHTLVLSPRELPLSCSRDTGHQGGVECSLGQGHLSSKGQAHIESGVGAGGTVSWPSRCPLHPVSSFWQVAPGTLLSLLSSTPLTLPSSPRTSQGEAPRGSQYIIVLILGKRQQLAREPGVVWMGPCVFVHVCEKLP